MLIKACDIISSFSIEASDEHENYISDNIDRNNSGRKVDINLDLFARNMLSIFKKFNGDLPLTDRYKTYLDYQEDDSYEGKTGKHNPKSYIFCKYFLELIEEDETVLNTKLLSTVRRLIRHEKAKKIIT